MSIQSVIDGTIAGKIEWRVHDAMGMSKGGFWAHILSQSGPEFRLDCIDGVYTLMRAGVLLEKEDDVDGLLAKSISDYIDSTKTAVIELFETELAKVQTTAEQVQEFEEAL